MKERMSVQRASVSGLPKFVAGSLATLGVSVGLTHSPPPAFADDPTTQPAHSAPQLAPELPTTADAIQPAFNDLANSEPAVRAQALTKLMGLDSADLPQLKKIVQASCPLAPSQAAALHQIVRQVFLSGQRADGNPTQAGFLGVTMNETHVRFQDAFSDEPSAPSYAIVITERMPGYAGARVLRDGDVILSILDFPDAPLTDTEAFGMLVRSIGAGGTAHFRLQRDGQIIDVGVRLDPRPIEAELGRAAMNDLRDQRQERAEDYWKAEFAEFLTQGLF